MSTNAKKKYLETFCQDEKGKYGLEHADGTPCDAKTPDACPKEHKAQQADELSGTQKTDGGVSSKKIDVSFAEKVDDMIRQKYPNISKENLGLINDEVYSELTDAVRTDFYDGGDIDDMSGWGRFRMRYDVPTRRSEYGDTVMDSDGKWHFQYDIEPEWSSKRIDGDLEDHNKNLREEYGIELRRNEEASEAEMDPDLEYDAKGRLVAHCDADLTLYSVDENKLNGFVKDIIERKADWAVDED